MELLSDCPECGKQLSKTRKYCACGWKTPIIQDQLTIDKHCQYQTAQGRCKEIATVCPGVKEKKWFCSKHWYIAISENYNY